MTDSPKQLTGLKKRQQIANANKLIFLWVIIAAVAISICGVAIQFLFRQAAFNQKIISEKSKTQSVLAQNIENANQLKEKVNELLANTNLAKVKANPEDTALKVILDALPTNDDKSALATSLQQVVLPKSGVSLTELSTITAFTSTGLAEEAAPTNGAQTNNYNFGVTGNYDQIKNMLTDLEHSIRPMNISSLSIQGSDSALRVTIEGTTYYLPERTVELGKKTVKP